MALFASVNTASAGAITCCSCSCWPQHVWGGCCATLDQGGHLCTVQFWANAGVGAGSQLRGCQSKLDVNRRALHVRTGWASMR